MASKKKRAPSIPEYPVSEARLRDVADLLRRHGYEVEAAQLFPDRWWEVRFSVPVRTEAHINKGGKLRAKFAAKAAEKRATALAYAAANSPRPPDREGTRLCCRLTRVAPKSLDKDNLGTATKYVQDELCRCLGLARANGQAKDEGDVITFFLHQDKGGVREYAVDVHLWLELVV